MPAQTRNKTNPCSRILGELAKTCFLIGAETDFTADFYWHGNTNNLRISVVPKGASLDHAVLEFDEYLNIPEHYGTWVIDEFRTDTYPKFKRFAAELKAFHENRLED